MMCRYDFYDCLKMSTESRQLETDKETLKRYFGNAVQEVIKTDVELDKTGIDYIVVLKSNVKIGVDVKTRTKGCSKYWKNGAEFALEVWSQRYQGAITERDKKGWTLDEKKQCDYVMFKFDKTDCDLVYVLPFQQLRKAFQKNIKPWINSYRHEWQRQRTAEYKSACVFVPASVVCEAVKSTFAGTLVSGDAHD